MAGDAAVRRSRAAARGAPANGANSEADRADAAYARRLRDALGGLGMLGALAAPQSDRQLLTLLVRNAMQVTGAKVGTLRLLDTATNELVFEVIEGTALLPEAMETVRQFRVPLGQGIARLGRGERAGGRALRPDGGCALRGGGATADRVRAGQHAVPAYQR